MQQKMEIEIGVLKRNDTQQYSHKAVLASLLLGSKCSDYTAMMMKQLDTILAMMMDLVSELVAVLLMAAVSG